jgi:4-amino-4-deoxy-L-arabinose transferase-like glycosyltransferase
VPTVVLITTSGAVDVKTNLLNVSPRALMRAAIWGLVAWVVVFWRLGYPSLLDPDEAHYAQLTREMLRAHSWLVPLLDGAPYIDKPVLFHWLQGLSVAALGESELANRLPNALSALCLIAIVRWVGGQLFDRKTGEWAALMFATIPATFALARVALFDMLFATCLFGGVACLMVGALRERPRLQYHGFALIALAIMTKGPVALILVMLFAAAAFCAGGDSRRAMRRIHWVTGMACGALAASPWFTWMWLRFGDRFVQEYLIAGNLWYFTKPPVFSTKATSDAFYLHVFTGGFFPWSLIALARGADVLRARWDGIRPSVEERVLWLWLLVVVGFFTAARFRLDHYIFPAAPACCLLAAVGWRRAVAGTHATATRMALVAIAATFLIGGAIAGAAIMRINLGLGRTALMLPIVLCFGGATLLVQIARARWSTPDSPAAPLLTLIAVYVMVVLVGFPVLERSRPASTLGPSVKARTAIDTPIGVYQLEWAASIRYYADRRVIALPDADAVRAFFRSWPYAYVFMLRQDQASVSDSPHDIHEVAATEAIVGRTGRYIRRQVWGAVTVVSRHTRGVRRPRTGSVLRPGGVHAPERSRRRAA